MQRNELGRISMFLLLMASFAFADVNVSQCGFLNGENTTFLLNQSLTNSTTCITFNATNQTLDCQGNTITGQTSGNGIVTTKNLSTIKNCIVSNFSLNFYLQSPAAYGKIQNSTSLIGTIQIEGSFNNISGSFANSTGKAIDIEGANNGSIFDTTTYSTGTGLDIYKGSYFDIYNSTFSGVAISGAIGCGNNKFTDCNVTKTFSFQQCGSNILNRVNLTAQITFSDTCDSNIIANSSLSSVATPTINIDWALNNNNIFFNNSISGAGLGTGHTLLKIGSAALFSSGNVFYLNNFTNTADVFVNLTNTNNYFSSTYDGKIQGNIFGNVDNGSVKIRGVNNSSVAGYYIGSSGQDFPYSNTTSQGKFICSLGGACSNNYALTPFANTAPNISLSSPASSIQINASSAALVWNGTDADGDTLIYSLFGGNTSAPTTMLYNGAATNHTWASFTLGAVNYWFVNVTDGTTTVQSSTSNFTSFFQNTSSATQADALMNENVSWTASITVYGTSTCNYTTPKQQVFNLTSITNSSGGTVANTGNYTHAQWNCSAAQSPYMVAFYTEPIVYVSNTTSSVLGSNAELHTLTTVANQSITYNFSYTYPSGAQNRKMQLCNRSTLAACDVSNSGLWVAQAFTITTDTGAFQATQTSNETAYVTTYDAAVITGPGSTGTGSSSTTVINTTVQSTTPYIPGKVSSDIPILSDLNAMFSPDTNAGYTEGILNYWILSAFYLVYLFASLLNASKPEESTYLGALDIPVFIVWMIGLIMYWPKTVI